MNWINKGAEIKLLDCAQLLRRVKVVETVHTRDQDQRWLYVKYSLSLFVFIEHQLPGVEVALLSFLVLVLVTFYVTNVPVERSTEASSNAKNLANFLYL